MRQRAAADLEFDMAADDGFVTLRVLAAPGIAAPLVNLPAGTGMVLREFESEYVLLGEFDWSGVRLDVLANGSVVAEVPPVFDRDEWGRMRFRFASRFPTGVLVRGGEKIALRYEGPLHLTITVTSLLHDLP